MWDRRFLGDKAKPQSGRARAERLYECPKGMERHHIDGNPLNNSPENIMIVTVKEHRTLDGRSVQDKWGRYTKRNLPPPIRDKYGRFTTKILPPPKRDVLGRYASC